MVEFDRGMAGVLIVVLSLIASIGVGVVTNVSEKDTTEDVDRYVADITGAYTSQKDQSYTAYNPASNYNGYSSNIAEGTAVNGDWVDYVNNYPITETGGSQTYDCTSSNIDTVLGTTVSSGMPAGEVWTDIRYQYTSFWSKSFVTTYKDEPSSMPLDIYNEYMQRSAMRVTYSGIGAGQKYIPISDLLADITETAQTPGSTINQIKITIPVKVTELHNFYENNPNYNMNTTFSYYYIDNFFQIRDFSTQAYNGGYQQSMLGDVGVGNTFYIELTYNTYNHKAILTIGPNYRVVYDNLTKLYLAWNGSNPVILRDVETKRWYPNYADSPIDEQSYTTSTYVTNYSNKLSVTVNYDVTAHYLDTRYGVEIPNDRTSTWSNGEKNGVTDIVFSTTSPDSTYSDTAKLYITKGETINTDEITIYRDENVNYVTVNDGVPIEIGTWDHFLLRIDTVTKALTIIPIETWSTFNDYLLSTVSMPIGSLNNSGDLTKIEWTATNSYRLQVTDTRVFLNTYGVILINPNIMISDLWPTYTRYMVNFTKVANVGDSITLGTETYPMEGNYLLINDKKLDFTDLKIYYTKNVAEDETVSWDLELKSKGTTVETNVAQTYIGLNGTWYFNSGFYNVVTEETKEVFWDSIYIFDYTIVGFFMLGIMALMGVIFYKKEMLDPISGVILIATGFILIVLIGGS